MNPVYYIIITLASVLAVMFLLELIRGVIGWFEMRRFVRTLQNQYTEHVASTILTNRRKAGR